MEAVEQFSTDREIYKQVSRQGAAVLYMLDVWRETYGCPAGAQLVRVRNQRNVGVYKNILPVESFKISSGNERGERGERG